jgi:hypothetical protein
LAQVWDSGASVNNPNFVLDEPLLSVSTE